MAAGRYRRHTDSLRVIPATVTGSIDVRIATCSDEDRDGVERYVTINGQIHLLSPAAVRQVAAELIEAADELDARVQVMTTMQEDSAVRVALIGLEGLRANLRRRAAADPKQYRARFGFGVGDIDRELVRAIDVVEQLRDEFTYQRETTR
jgi:hypothetical protein